jgi:hypothetical protein
MPLVFPTSPSQSQTYASGSSAVYQWNGLFWDVVSPPTATTLNAVTASYALTGGSGGGGASVTVSGSVPSGSVSSGSLWWNDNNGNLYIQTLGPSGSTYAPAVSNVLSATTSSYAVTASYALSAATASLSDSTKLWFLHAFSNASYTIPGSFTIDLCRYNNIATQVNTTGWFNTSNYRFTPQKAGYWEIVASYEIFRGSGIETSIRIRKNGTEIKYTGILGTVSVDTTTIVFLNGTTDYIDIVNNGANSSARTQTATTSIFQARWVGN